MLDLTTTDVFVLAFVGSYGSVIVACKFYQKMQYSKHISILSNHLKAFVNLAWLDIKTAAAMT